MELRGASVILTSREARLTGLPLHFPQHMSSRYGNIVGMAIDAKRTELEDSQLSAAAHERIQNHLAVLWPLYQGLIEIQNDNDVTAAAEALLRNTTDPA